MRCGSITVSGATYARLFAESRRRGCSSPDLIDAATKGLTGTYVWRGKERAL